MVDVALFFGPSSQVVGGAHEETPQIEEEDGWREPSKVGVEAKRFGPNGEIETRGAGRITDYVGIA